ncbi:phosphatidylinositide phosphatase SAC1-like [Pomacea canaliculata]|uniref:phosphatidylinositide phosphatase SAC1-like n=1 Tax=Pomacea canaliculata TaxID=400727 RepID=UPI000D72667A|nr:phosphatidylinositide phosphatase SAC1-like [Pomacea canaliculata]
MITSLENFLLKKSRLFVSANMAVHEVLRLHITSERFIVEPRGGDTTELLIIDRVTQEITLQGNQGQIPASAITKSIYGILGIIRLVAGAYLIVITKREKVGEVKGHTIWRVADTEIHSYKRTTTHLTEQQNSLNKTYLSLVENMLRTEFFYFSPTYDISHSLQRLHNTSPEFQSLALHERADQRFVWNGHVLRELTQQPELSRYCLPVILGFIEVSSCQINGKSFDYTLISRRCIYRAGTRFNVRGVDSEGQVANFVETEQIVQYNGHCCSFVQTRGSIPLFWSQRADLKRIPNPVLIKANHLSGFQKHFDNQIYNYGYQVIVNLVNQKGYEKELETMYGQTVSSAKNANIRYEAFDFHKECKNMRFDRLSLLLDRLEGDIKRFGYFHQNRDGFVVSQQCGVFRTNCMDCLDRTNVVQGLIGREVLKDQLTRLGVLEAGQNIEDQKQFDTVFRNVWADNADVISKQYAGTGALKTDFTRTGKRTALGGLMDGWNSLVRYIRNNFQDGIRQDAIDLFLGNHVVEETEGLTSRSPLAVQRDWKYYAIPVILMIASAMLIITILLPDEQTSEQLMYIFFWGAAAIISLATLFWFGTVFVDQPRLLNDKIKIE